MEIFELPQYLAPDNTASTLVYDYNTRTECSKQMVDLQQNVFSFLQEGQKEVITGQDRISIPTEKFLLMKAGHCLMTEKLSSGLHYRSVLFFFSDELIEEIVTRHDLIISPGSRNESVWPLHYDAFLSKFVESLLDLSRASTRVQEKLLRVKLEELILYLAATQGSGFLSLFQNPSDDKTRHFFQVVEHNKLNRLSLKELAFLAHMSISSFKREFEKHFHVSPSKWFQDQRLEYSAYLLKSQGKRPSDIFEEIGYENLSNFIQAFKAKYGVTPKQYQLG